jgi:DNA polymerase III epsilon subunit-like protein
MAEAINHFRTNHILFGFNNIDFDSKGIEKDFKRYNLKLAKVENGEYDLRSGEKFLTGDKSLKGKLHEICRKYGIEITNSELHGAGYDSFITAMLLDRLIGIYGIDIITNKIIASNFQKPLRF